MEKEITSEDYLLDEKGELKHKGYAKSLILKYDRKMIKAAKRRIKEWDYYLIYNQNYAIALTIDDNSYMGLTSVSLIDFRTAKEHTISLIKFFTNGKTKLPATSAIGNVSVKNKKINISFKNDGKKRTLFLSMKNFYKGKSLKIEATLTDEPKDSMVIVTPFAEDKKAFYYNQKIVGMKAEGYIEYEGDKHYFDKMNTRAILDWGRGVWTYKNTWFWGGGAFTQDGHELGFNIGYGFGDTTAASENMFFFDGKAHKLDRLTFNIPVDSKGNDNYMKSWTFTSNDNRFTMTFNPIIDRHADTDIKLICSKQHQVFGLFNGTVVLDDGTKIEIKNQIGFAEKVFNKW